MLPVGGLKEKILAAKRADIKIIILPKQNKKDLEEIPSHLKRGLEFVFVDQMEQVLGTVFRKKRRSTKPKVKKTSQRRARKLSQAVTTQI